MVSYADCEPAITDARLAPIEEAVRRRYWPHLNDSTFVTARVQPPTGDEEIHFQILTLYPKEPQRSLGIMHGSLGRTTAAAWDEYEAERSHYVMTQPDAAEKFFMALGKMHVDELRSIRELITDDIDRARPKFD